jgi:hypothetical protein
MFLFGKFINIFGFKFKKIFTSDYNWKLFTISLVVLFVVHFEIKMAYLFFSKKSMHKTALNINFLIGSFGLTTSLITRI